MADDQTVHGRPVPPPGAVGNAMSGSVSGNVVQAASIGSVHFHEPAVDRRAPAQLPSSARTFVGRHRELEQLRATDAPLIVLSGAGGVGKTALALRWLRETHSDYPDGQLFVDLGTAPDADPVEPGDVLEWFLLSLDVAPEEIPVEVDQRAAMFRSLTADRRMIVLLDDAVSATQVRPLQPAGTGSKVVVTSRYRLSGLAMDGARWIDVEPLASADAIALFRAVLGDDRVNAESQAAQQVADACGGLPLALSVVAARLSTRPRRGFARELQSLLAETDRLTALSIEGDASVRAVLDLSCANLDADAESLYRRCAHHPGREFGADVAAFVTGWEHGRTLSVLDGLVEANVLVEKADERFGYHDLTLLHARERTPGDRRAAELTIVEWYLDRTVAADVLIHPHRLRIGPRYPSAGDAVFRDHHAALSWLELERANVRSAFEAASRHGRDDMVWQWCEALWGFFLHTRHYGDWIFFHHNGIAAAQRCADPRAEARMRSQLGFAYAKLHRFSEAVAENTTALALAEQAHDSHTIATALSQLGRAARGSGDLPAALDYFTRARDLRAELGQRRGSALCGRRIGQILARQGNHAEAIAELEAAAATMRDLGDHTQNARALMELGTTLRHAGDLERAGRALRDALTLMRDFGSPYYQAEVLGALAEHAQATGQTEAARAGYREAAELYTATEDPKAELMRTRLAGLT